MDQFKRFVRKFFGFLSFVMGDSFDHWCLFFTEQEIKQLEREMAKTGERQLAVELQVELAVRDDILRRIDRREERQKVTSPA